MHWRFGVQCLTQVDVYSSCLCVRTSRNPILQRLQHQCDGVKIVFFEEELRAYEVVVPDKNESSGARKWVACFHG